MKYQRVLGIDPGIVNIGLGIVSQHKKNDYYLVHNELIKSTEEYLISKIENIYDKLISLITDYQPTSISYERPTFICRGNNGPDIEKVIGIIYLICAKQDLPLYSYTPAAIKKSVTGKGRASKIEVENGVKKILQLPDVIFKTDHQSDAVAIALTHLLKTN